MIATISSPIGLLKISAEQGSITSLRFVESPTKGDVYGVIARAADQLGEYFLGQRREFDLPILLYGTAFQKEVWKRLQQIPYGQTMTYSDLAHQIGRPDAQRAVGAANGQNPISIIVPCHRVIASTGKLHGYSGGLDKKKWLLQLESEQSSLF